MSTKIAPPLEDLAQARKYVLFLLSRRDYSRAQLEKKLRLRLLSAEDTKLLLDEFINKGWFREVAYSKARARQLLKKGFGPNLVKAKLKMEKAPIDESIIQEAYDCLNSSADKELAEGIKKYLRKIERSRHNYSIKELQYKVVNALMKKGHRIDDIKRLMSYLSLK